MWHYFHNLNLETSGSILQTLFFVTWICWNRLVVLSKVIMVLFRKIGVRTKECWLVRYISVDILVLDIFGKIFAALSSSNKPVLSENTSLMIIIHAEKEISIQMLARHYLVLSLSSLIIINRALASSEDHAVTLLNHFTSTHRQLVYWRNWAIFKTGIYQMSFWL